MYDFKYKPHIKYKLNVLYMDMYDLSSLTAVLTNTDIRRLEMW